MLEKNMYSELLVWNISSYSIHDVFSVRALENTEWPLQAYSVDKLEISFA